MPGSAAEADAETVRAVIAAFDQADEAMRRKDVDTVMAFYSDTYNYLGFTKADIRKIWEDLFVHYRNIGSSQGLRLEEKWSASRLSYQPDGKIPVS